MLYVENNVTYDMTLNIENEKYNVMNKNDILIKKVIKV